jgi:hypothetical protein
MTTKTKTKNMSNTKAGSKKNVPAKQQHHKHGAVLTGLLILMALHGLVAAAAYGSMTDVNSVNRPLAVSLMVVHSLANIVAAAGIYSWKKWGLYVYGVSAVLALAAGLISVGFWSVFYMLFPLAIAGWVLRDKWAFFE